MGKRWRIYPHDADRIVALEKSARISPILAQLLVARGVCDPNEVQRFLDARMNQLRDPEDLPGIPAAADRVHAAIRERRRIAIYGDYDADGMTGTAILVRCVQLLGGDVTYYVPNRLEEGYGLHADALEKLSRRGTAMVVSVDCGIASVDEAIKARELGLELIVTDHHELSDELPSADAVVHPRLPGSDYAFGELCGAGVAFKLAWALCCRASQSKRVSERMRSYLLSAIGLAAMGTVADVVPLLDENRVIVRHGLKSLRERPPLGIKALLSVMGWEDKPELQSEDIAFGIAPRLNAAGRLWQAQLGVELLTTESPERAQALAEYIDQLNKSRDSLERRVYLAANQQIKAQFDAQGDPAFVLAGTGWHSGVIGIVAGRLAEKYHRPVVLIAVDQVGAKPASGSGRSACGLNLHEALQQCGEHLLTHGGHAAAAGLRLEESQIDAFRAAFCEHVAGSVAPEERVAEVHIDAEAPLSQLTLSTMRQIEQLAPFGASNARPVFCASAVQMAEPPKPMGGGDRHLSVKLTQHGIKLRAIGFGWGDRLEDLARVDRPIDVAYRPVINEFRGRRSVEIHFVDWRASERPALAPSGPAEKGS
ncbi:MAG: single-stranded-DNA-specific exonuclease RecJ [Pirellulales bacterium]